MAIGMIKNLTVVGLMEESTEGTYLAPASATDYIQPQSDGFEVAGARELLDRDILDASIGMASPILGIKSVTSALPVELRASGTEGAATDFDLLVKGALGATRAITTTTTTKASGNTGSVLQIEDADISKFAVGDIIAVKESGAHHVGAITAVATGVGVATITITPAKPSGVFSNSVVISKSKMYYTANSGHPPLSVSIYQGNTIRQSAVGCKVSSMSIENFSTGQLASMNFALEGLTFDQVDGAAPHTPTFDSGLPPVILSACVYKDGTSIDINEFGISVANTLSFITATCNANGRASSRVTKREITGSINPYKDDTSVANHTAFIAGTTFSLLVRAYIPSSTAGEMTMGSIVGIYLPNCFTTELATGDQDGILTDQISFKATRGTTGATEEMYMGFI